MATSMTSIVTKNMLSVYTLSEWGEKVDIDVTGWHNLDKNYNEYNVNLLAEVFVFLSREISENENENNDDMNTIIKSVQFLIQTVWPNSSKESLNTYVKADIKFKNGDSYLLEGMDENIDNMWVKNDIENVLWNKIILLLKDKAIYENKLPHILLEFLGPIVDNTTRKSGNVISHGHTISEFLINGLCRKDIRGNTLSVEFEFPASPDSVAAQICYEKNQIMPWTSKPLIAEEDEEIESEWDYLYTSHCKDFKGYVMKMLDEYNYDYYDYDSDYDNDCDYDDDDNFPDSDWAYEQIPKQLTERTDSPLSFYENEYIFVVKEEVSKEEEKEQLEEKQDEYYDNMYVKSEENSYVYKSSSNRKTNSKKKKKGKNYIGKEKKLFKLKRTKPRRGWKGKAKRIEFM